EQWLLIKMKDEFARPESGGIEPPAKRPRATTTQKATRSRVRAAGNGKQPAEMPAVTHGDKVLFPDLDITKAEVFEFYRRIAPYLLPHLHDRPATLERLPEGLAGPDAPHFWQKNASAYYPSWIPLAELTTERGKPVRYVLVNSVE